MHFQQTVTNTVAKRASSGEITKWRDSGIDPELLSAPQPAETTPYIASETAGYVSQLVVPTTVHLEER
ncbi:MAG: hypothetical protein QFB87_03790 [Patescibacteria group bacterium]|nr:hypothetical protein [Patescibacteria group bacterium]